MSSFGFVAFKSLVIDGEKVIENYERRFGLGTETIRVGLVGCSAQKALVSCPARDLYRSPLFRAARAYAEATCERWFILSALYGLIDPATSLAPYDYRLPRGGSSSWGRTVGIQLEKKLPFPEFANAELVVLAGADYADAISPVRGREFLWDEPLKGKGIGERLRWLKTHTPKRKA